MQIVRIKIVKGFRPDRFSEFIHAGEVFEARRLTFNAFDMETPFQIIEGKHSGQEVPFKFCIVLPKERTYTEAEYRAVYQELLQRREEVAALREEKRMLQEEINQLVAEKKVVLPPEVANALDKEFGSANEEQKQWGFSNIVRLHPIHLSPEARKIKDYFHAAKYLNLAQALIYGYTVEQTLEQRIRQGVQKIYEQWTQIPSTGDDQADGADLAERITKFVAAELKL